MNATLKASWVVRSRSTTACSDTPQSTRRCQIDELRSKELRPTAVVNIDAAREVFRTAGPSRAGQNESVDQNPQIREDNNIVLGRDDHARFANLVMPHLDDAYSLARWITGNRDDAEDVVQDACLRAFRAIGGLVDATARPWMLTIVRNTAYSWLRKNRPSAELVVEDLEVVESAQAVPGDPEIETPETTLIAKADAASLEAAIAALPMPYRETMILRDVQGLSYREIGAITGVPIGTVMSRLARGRNRVIETIGRSVL
jgi:RNA polymerase sigma factor (sigma-70 family)